ncbi:MAG TPA: FKBP-type peptidyl-prolyl cis-trans isomerase [Candidatus Blautia excrementigallinarum]|nr:FKBP-type peptidyl-prolyl cis-trans isomerase [Candidatus Blautia excrementigallinarum]
MKQYEKRNRRLAQERRAAERKLMERKKRRNKILKIAVPVLIIAILIIVIIVDSVRNSQNTAEDSASSTSETTAESTAEPTEAPSLQTDVSLTVEDGDTVNIDYVGTVDGTEFDGGSTGGMGTDLTIGSGLYIDDFEDQLVGSHPGDEVEVTVTFPEDYGKEDLNGKEAVFDVTVNGIYE